MLITFAIKLLIDYSKRFIFCLKEYRIIQQGKLVSMTKLSNSKHHEGSEHKREYNSLYFERDSDM